MPSKALSAVSQKAEEEATETRENIYFMGRKKKDPLNEYRRISDDFYGQMLNETFVF